MQTDKMKTGLGRGLGALIGPSRSQEDDASSISSPEEGIHVLDPQKILVNKEQPRTVFADDALDELTESIREHGILQPLVVIATSEGVYELIAGERRLRAAKRLGLLQVPVIVHPQTGLKDKLVLALIENIQRQDLNAVEEGRAYKRLAEEYGLAHEDIAHRVGKSRSAVTNAIRLLDLDEDMLSALEEGRISKSHARTLLAEPVSELRRSLFSSMLEGGVTVREAEARAGSGIRGVRRSIRDPHVATLETALREKLGTKVRLEHRGGSGKIVISYYSKEDLRRIVAQLAGEELLEKTSVLNESA